MFLFSALSQRLQNKRHPRLWLLAYTKEQGMKLVFVQFVITNFTSCYEWIVWVEWCESLGSILVCPNIVYCTLSDRPQ